MNTIVLEHVSISELPDAWRAKIAQSFNQRVTVRIEEEMPVESTVAQTTPANPLFGLWRNREDMDDVTAYLRQQRAARF